MILEIIESIGIPPNHRIDMRLHLNLDSRANACAGHQTQSIIDLSCSYWDVIFSLHDCSFVDTLFEVVCILIDTLIQHASNAWLTLLTSYICTAKSEFLCEPQQTNTSAIETIYCEPCSGLHVPGCEDGYLVLECFFFRACLFCK